MKTRFVLNAMLIIMAVLSTTASAETAQESARRLVETTGLGNNLTLMAAQVARNTTTYKVMVLSVGEQQAKQLVMAEIAKAKPDYQEAWNKNLAECYAQTFTPEELESLANNPKSSPFVPKAIAGQAQVGKLMKEKSDKLFEEFVAAVVLAAYSKASPK